MICYTVVNATTGAYLANARYMDFTRDVLEAIHYTTEAQATGVAGDCYSECSDQVFGTQMVVITTELFPIIPIPHPWANKWVIRLTNNVGEVYYWERRTYSSRAGIPTLNPRDATRFSSEFEAGPVVESIEALIGENRTGTTVDVVQLKDILENT